MYLEREISNLFSDTTFNSACASAISNPLYRDKLENFLIFCVHYVDDARTAASELFLLANNRVSSKGVDIITIKGNIATLPTREYIEEVKRSGREALNIIANFPFGKTTDLPEDTFKILHDFDIWISGNDVPLTEFGRNLLCREFKLELNETAIVLIERAHKTAIKLKLILAMVDKNI